MLYTGASNHGLQTVEVKGFFNVGANILFHMIYVFIEIIFEGLYNILNFCVVVFITFGALLSQNIYL